MEKECNFVDLSNLPCRPNGNYNWEQSVGMSFRFCYKGINGYIDVLDYDKENCRLRIFIDGYTSKNGVILYNSQVKNCILGKVLKPKIASTHPYLMKYFYDLDDTLKYTSGSAKRVLLVCPVCGNHRYMQVCDLVNYGFRCDMCGDGFSYPNKFMKSLLEQLNISFIRELSCVTPGFEWVKSYKYDFYIDINDKQYFIEMDGGFHFNDVFNTLSNVQASDINKDLLAKEHDIEVVRIDCNYKDLSKRSDYVIRNILSSKLNSLLHLTDYEIDWGKCDLAATKTLLIDICALWNKQYSIIEISNNLNIAPVTVRAYLRHGTKLNLTYYNGREEKSKKRAETNRKMAKNKTTPIAIYKDDKLIGVFDGCKTLAKQSMSLFNKKFNDSVLYKAVNGDNKHAYGYTIQRITKEEFQQYMAEHNNQLIIGGDNIGLTI